MQQAGTKDAGRTGAAAEGAGRSTILLVKVVAGMGATSSTISGVMAQRSSSARTGVVAGGQVVQAGSSSSSGVKVVIHRRASPSGANQVCGDAQGICLLPAQRSSYAAPPLVAAAWQWGIIMGSRHACWQGLLPGQEPCSLSAPTRKICLMQ
jgi:hypothetical protein